MCFWGDDFGGGGGKPTLVVVYHIAQVISSAVVCLAHAEGVVREVDIAVVACGEGG